MGKVFLTSGSGDGTVKLRTLQIASRPTKTNYKAGELLDLTGLKIVAVWSDGTSDDVTNSCTYVPAAGTPVYETVTKIDISYTDSTGATHPANQPIIVTRTLDSIEITKAPTKLSYTAGETLNLSGMVVTAKYNSGATENVTSSVTVDPVAGTALYEDDKSFTVSYTEGDVTKSATQNFTVSRVLDSIEITTKPTQLTYNVNDPINIDGMVVTATYTSGNTEVLDNENITYSPTTAASVATDPQTITVSYSEGGVTRVAQFNVTTVEGEVVTITTSVAPIEGVDVPELGAHTITVTDQTDSQYTQNLSMTAAGEAKAVILPGHSYTVSVSEVDGLMTPSATASKTAVANGQQSYSMAYQYFTAWLTVTSDKGASVKAVGVNTKEEYTGTIGDDGTTMLVIHKSDTYTVTATLNGKTTKAQNIVISTHLSKDNAVKCMFLELVRFTEGTPEQLAAMIEASYGENGINLQDYWAVNEATVMDLAAMNEFSANNAGNVPGTASHVAQKMRFVILDFDHDILATPKDGKTTASITIGMQDLMVKGDNNGGSTMNGSNNTNSGGWAQCARRTWLNDTFLKAMPTPWQEVIKTTTRKTCMSYNSATQSDSSEKIFMLSEFEVQGAKTYAPANEGTQYTYFKTSSRKVMHWTNVDGTSTGSAYYWFLRSVRSRYSADFCGVYSGGSAAVSAAADGRTGFVACASA